MLTSPRGATHAATSSSVEPTWHHRVLSVLLRAFPVSFREHYGADLTRCVQEARSDLGDLSRAKAMRFWAATFADVGRQGIRERLGGMREWWAAGTYGGTRVAPASPVRHGVGRFLLLAAASNVIYDVVSTRNSMGVLAVLLTAVGAASGLFLLRPPRPRHRY